MLLVNAICFFRSFPVWSTHFHAVGLQRHFFLELVGCYHSRLLVGSSAFVMDGGFLCPFPDLVDVLCDCMLLLIHCCLFYSGLCWFAAVPGGVEVRGSLVFAPCWLVPPSRAGYKYGAVVRWCARQRQPSYGSTWGCWILPFSCLGSPCRLLTSPLTQSCVAGGMNANVFTCFSVDGTGMRGVTVRLFFPDGVMGDPRFVLIFCLSRVPLACPSAPLLCPCAVGSTPRGLSCWRSVRLVVVVRFSASPCTLIVSSPLRLFFRPGPGVCRRPGRGRNTGLSQLAIFDICPGLLVFAAVPGGG